jgi:hypothetical protein
MKKNLLITLLTFAILPIFMTAQNNGAGCAKAIPAVLGTYIVDTMFTGVATFSAFDPFPSRAIWYKYTPPSDGLLSISSCGGGADTRLFLYSGTCGQLVSVAFSDDFCDYDGSGEELAANITRPVKAGTTYFFEFDNAWSYVDFSFTLSLATFTPRATQTCATATTIAPGVITVDSLFGFSSRSDAARANWYKFTPTRNGKIGISTCGNDLDTRLWVYRGTCAALVPIADSDDDCLGLADSIAVSIRDLAVTANQTYYFEFDDAWENDNFSFIFTFDMANSVEDNRLAQAVSLAPNPATDAVDVLVDLDKTRDLSLKIFNTVGQQVLSEKMGNILRGPFRLNTSALKSGVYIVEISDGTAKTRKKLVISR